MKALKISDLNIEGPSASNTKESAHPLSREQMQRVRGGRAIVVTVDGRSGGTVDDFSLNMEIFKGNIGGPMV